MSDARKAAEERLQRKFQMATSVLDALQTSVSDARRALSDVASAAWDAVEAGQAARTPQITDEMVERAAEALRPGLFTLSLSGYERRFDSYGEETRRLHQETVLEDARIALEAALGQTNDTKEETA